MRLDIHRGGIFQIITMKSKSESSTILYRINLDVGVENKIFIDNAPDNTGYNT